MAAPDNVWGSPIVPGSGLRYGSLTFRGGTEVRAYIVEALGGWRASTLLEGGRLAVVTEQRKGKARGRREAMLKEQHTEIY